MEARKHNLALVDLLTQIALAWLLAQKPWIISIPGTTSLKHLEENLQAAKIELSSDDLREIAYITSKIKVQRSRLPEENMELLNY